MMQPRLLLALSIALVCAARAPRAWWVRTTSKPVLPAARRLPRRDPRRRAASLAEPKWWDVFADEQLQALVRTATDARTTTCAIAAARV